jgi:hypothetical protein
MHRGAAEGAARLGEAQIEAGQRKIALRAGWLQESHSACRKSLMFASRKALGKLSSSAASLRRQIRVLREKAMNAHAKIARSETARHRTTDRSASCGCDHWRYSPRARPRRRKSRRQGAARRGRDVPPDALVLTVRTLVWPGLIFLGHERNRRNAAAWTEVERRQTSLPPGQPRDRRSAMCTSTSGMSITSEGRRSACEVWPRRVPY